MTKSEFQNGNDVIEVTARGRLDRSLGGVSVFTGPKATLESAAGVSQAGLSVTPRLILPARCRQHP